MIAFILCVCGLTSATKDNAPTFESIFSQLQKNGRIWVHRRSFEGDGMRCIFNEKLLLKGEDYIFNKWHKSGEKMVKNVAHGKIYKVQGEKNWKSAMNVTTIPQGLIKTYILQFWDSRQQCGVLTSDDEAGKKQCELHSLAQVGRPFEKCLKRYRNQCKDETYIEYIINNVNCN
uniref:Putative group i salivary lipocalin n=1 Tax=Rhipicephalus pulchellus TaxID=72859 RepID=L7LTA5_RHIPC